MADNISSLKNCYGCGVCVCVCPVEIISLEENADGFYAPVIHEHERCINCGLCLKICAFNHEEIASDPSDIRSMVGWSKDESVRKSCSSGGVGFEIGKKLLSEGYTAVGVRYDTDSKRAQHYISHSIDEFKASIGSKYIPSFTADAFRRMDLKQKYFLTGTPCQIDSFRRLIKLRKVEDNFILLDFFCHGVPSLLLWDKYIGGVEAQIGKSCRVAWRDKASGWQDSWSMQIDSCEHASGSERKYSSRMSQGDLFYDFFLGNYCLNHCCYKSCKYKMMSSSADIRIGDCWGQAFSDNSEGVSVAIALTGRGQMVLANLKAECYFEPQPIGISCEDQMRHSPEMPFIRKALLAQLRSSRSLQQIRSGLIAAYRLTLIHKRIYRRLKRIMERRRK